MRVFCVEREAPEVVTGICDCHDEVRAAVAPFCVCMMFPFLSVCQGTAKCITPFLVLQVPAPLVATSEVLSGIAGTSPELISSRSEEVRMLTLVSTAKSLVSCF